MSVEKILIRFHTFGKKYHCEREGWFMPIIIPNVVHMHTGSAPVPDYLHCARVLRLRDAVPPLQQPISFPQAQKHSFKTQ